MDPPNGMMGIDAGDYHAGEGCPDGCGGAGCWVFMDRDQAGWNYVNAHCAQATGSIPGPQDLVYVTGCANVRDRPGSTERILACLPNQTVVDVDSAPVFAEGKIWWHLKDRWMAPRLPGFASAHRLTAPLTPLSSRSVSILG